MYTKGEIIENSNGGRDIEILDPYGDLVCYLHTDHTVDRGDAEELLNNQAEGLLSHLNRG